MRFVSFLLLVVLAACGPRNIDRSVGVGPQGGPRDKTQPPGYNPFRLNLGIGTQYSEKVDLKNWEIYQLADYDEFSASDTVGLEANSSNILSIPTYGLKIVRGTYHCIDDANAALSECNNEHFILPNEWRSGSIFIPEFTMEFDVHREPDCVLTGQFDDESQPAPWAKGWYQVLKNFHTDPESARSLVHLYAPSRMRLETDPSLVGPSDRTANIFFRLASSYTTGTFVMPSHTHSGREIDPADLRESFNFAPTRVPTIYEASVYFKDKNTAAEVVAKVWLNCHAIL